MPSSRRGAIYTYRNGYLRGLHHLIVGIDFLELICQQIMDAIWNESTHDKRVLLEDGREWHQTMAEVRVCSKLGFMLCLFHQTVCGARNLQGMLFR